MTADAERLAAIRERLIQDFKESVELYYSSRYSEHRDLDAETTADNLRREGVVAELLVERDALRARIDAARWVYINVTSRFEAAVKMNAALAGDQPEATPEPPNRPHGAEALHAAGEAAVAFIESLPLSEPPHLDPEPMHATYMEVEEGNNSHRYYFSQCSVCDWVGPRRREWVRADCDAFEHRRPADENGKAYSKDRADYGVQS